MELLSDFVSEYAFHFLHFLIFVFGAFFYLVVVFLITFLRRHPTFESFLKIFRRVAMISAIVCAVHSVIFFAILKVFYPAIFSNLFACFLFGFISMAAPASVLMLSSLQSRKLPKGLQPVFTLMNTFKEIYQGFIANEINYEFRYRAWRIVEAERDNEFRAINRLFEEFKRRIAEHQRDEVFKSAAKAYGIFQVRNPHTKNSYLMDYFGYVNYQKQLRRINSGDAIQLGNWDCVERRTGNQTSRHRLRFYEQDDFRETFFAPYPAPS